MDKELLTMLFLRIGAIVLGDKGKTEEAAIANAILSGWQAGRNVDAEMARFTKLLGTDDEPSMQELIADLGKETDEFLSRGPDGQLPAA